MATEGRGGHFSEYLLHESQADNAENKALFQAAMKGDIREVKAALQRGGKPNFFFKPEDQKNSLHVAAEHGHEEVVEELLQHGAVVNAVAAKDHSTPLILAAMHNNPIIVSSLVKAGANINAGKAFCRYGLNFSAFVHCI
jgi:ankyrin repeat protein